MCINDIEISEKILLEESDWTKRYKQNWTTAIMISTLPWAFLAHGPLRGDPKKEKKKVDRFSFLMNGSQAHLYWIELQDVWKQMFCRCYTRWNILDIRSIINLHIYIWVYMYKIYNE